MIKHWPKQKREPVLRRRSCKSQWKPTVQQRCRVGGQPSCGRGQPAPDRTSTGATGVVVPEELRIKSQGLRKTVRSAHDQATAQVEAAKQQIATYRITLGRQSEVKGARQM